MCTGDVLVASVLMGSPQLGPPSPLGCKITSGAKVSPRSAAAPGVSDSAIPAYRPLSDASTDAAALELTDGNGNSDVDHKAAALEQAGATRQLVQAYLAPAGDAGTVAPPNGSQPLPRTLSAASDMSTHSVDPRSVHHLETKHQDPRIPGSHGRARSWTK